MTAKKKRYLLFISRILITAIVYLILFLPFQSNEPLLILIRRHIQGFFPIVMGIFWGLPSAIGIFLGSLFCEFSPSGSQFLIFPILISLSAISARNLYYRHHRMVNGLYIYNLSTLGNFIYTVVIVKLAYSCAVTGMFSNHDIANLKEIFNTVFFNNIEGVIFIGIPIMLFLPLIGKWADIPRGKDKKYSFVVANIFLLTSIPLMFYINEQNSFLLIIPLLGSALTGCPSPKVTTDSNGFYSLGYSTFRRMMIFFLITSVISCTVIFKEMGKLENITDLNSMFHTGAALTLINFFIFAYSLRIVQKKMIYPLQKIASKLSVSGEKYKDEFDIISKRLDFITSSQTELISSDEYSIIIGLTTRDNSKRFSVQEARMIINDICLECVSGYISSVDGVGGYRSENYEGGMEKMLIYTIFGASDEQICRISDKIIEKMMQESILIEKNRMIRYYYYGKQS